MSAIVDMRGRRVAIDGKPATIIGEWDDMDEGRRVFGYDYRLDGETARHWIVCGSPRMTELPA